MILSFSTDELVDAIYSGQKIHTIRTDTTKRWKPGMKIHFWRGNPRNTRGKVKPYQFGTGIVKDVGDFSLKIFGANIQIDYPITQDFAYMEKSDDFYTSFNQFAINDGFKTFQEFGNFFKDKNGNVNFQGRIIIWEQDTIELDMKYRNPLKVY